MIQANELRIGNLVYIKGTKAHIPIWKISEKKINKDLTPYALEPIPITEEWLVRFGFGNFTNTYQQRVVRCSKSILRKWTIVLDKMKTENHWNLKIYRSMLFPSEIKHIHQLQNLYFALTGQELKLNDK